MWGARWSRRGRRFHGPGGVPRVGDGRATGLAVRSVRAARRWPGSRLRARRAQGQVSGILIFAFALAADESGRRCAAAGSAASWVRLWPGGPSRHSSRNQHSRSHGDGRGHTPGLVDRDRVWTAGGRGRWSSRCGCGPPRGHGRGGGLRGIWTARPGCWWRRAGSATRRPPPSAHSCAPDEGRSRRQRIRMSAGQLAQPVPAVRERRSSPVSSTTPASAVEVAGLAVAVRARAPSRSRAAGRSRRGPRCVEVEPDRVVHPAPGRGVQRGDVVDQVEGGAGAIQVISSSPVPVRDLRDRLAEHRDVVAAVLEPALPGRSRNASDSPVLSHHAVSG